MSSSSSSSRVDPVDRDLSETTPLLARSSSNGNSTTRRPSVSHDDPETVLKSKRRWPSLVALLILCVAAVLVMILGFFMPSVVQQYALEAATIRLDSLVPEFTSTGARARIRGQFVMQRERVESAHIRRLGAFGTWIVGQVETGRATVNVTLPDYANVLLGTAIVPPIKVSVINGRPTDLDIMSDLVPPKSLDGIRTVVDDYLNHSLDHLSVAGFANVKIQSGWITLPQRLISHTISIQNKDIPEIPKFNITKLNFVDGELPDHTKGMEADASITVKNDFPIDLDLPPLNFDLLVDNCQPDEPKIMLADAAIKTVHVYPKKDITVNATGFVRKLPESLTDECPHSGKSPLDTLLGGYMRGRNITIFISGSKNQSHDTPSWLTNLLSSVTVPLPVPGHTFGDAIKNFTLANVQFSLPDPSADPNTPQSSPSISATIEAFIALPQEINVNVDVNRTRANADIFYKQSKLGELNLRKWQPAKSTPSGNDEVGRPLLLVKSDIVNAPVEITDEDTFTDVIQAMLFGRKPVILTLDAKVDVEIATTLGVLTVRDIPANGKVPVQPISLGHGDFDSLDPKISNMTITKTTATSLALQAAAGFRNPTEYAAQVPFADVLIILNQTILGHASVVNISITSGKNQNIAVRALWNPESDKNEVGRNLISQFVSGYNVSVTIKTHEGTFPSRPLLGRALSNFNITIPVPHVAFPSDPNDPGDDPDDPDGDPAPQGPRFIKSATMHLFSSTADFTLLSPLTSTILYLTSINATAYYKTDPVGTIIYEMPIAVEPGETETPRLPVDWSLGSVGYEAVRKALGGTLRLKAEAEIGVRIGKWQQSIWFKGRGIGAHVRL